MLILKPNCELCDKDLPADSLDACICSYECTFCRSCTDSILANVCPNCGGGFSNRPIRPKTARREGVSLKAHPASNERVLTRYTTEEIEQFIEHARLIPAHHR
jgi:hypothetical protein